LVFATFWGDCDFGQESTALPWGKPLKPALSWGYWRFTNDKVSDYPWFYQLFLMQNVLFLISELIHEIHSKTDPAPFAGNCRFGIAWLIGHACFCWQNH
jgi:hypothetical protein